MYKFNTAWCLMLILLYGCTSQQSVKNLSKYSTPNNEDHTKIQKLLETYFSSWSKNDMATYKSCFHHYAYVIRIQNKKVHSMLGLEKFIAQQTKYLTNARGPVSEKMVSFTIDKVDDVCATVTVNWVFKGEGDQWSGVDRFSLIRDANGDFKIITLLWYKNS